MEVNIRRSHVLEDALRGGHKKKFNPKKVLKVFHYLARLHVTKL